MGEGGRGLRPPSRHGPDFGHVDQQAVGRSAGEGAKTGRTEVGFELADPVLVGGDLFFQILYLSWKGEGGEGRGGGEVIA